ncbi:sulfatase-like hydrolase/transferase [Brachyspira intermedia]|uniref:sulfatase-like hydrolase/transferase n=1 Tax=Brachyspira intermedia TaxID=84377 RepID=UPI003003B31A
MKKNILFVFSDQQRWDTMGIYGQELDVTPNLDKLGKEGTIFDNAFTCQPVCGPARASLQTGLYSSKAGVFVNAISLPENITTIAKLLNDNGYQTGYVGKWHLATDGLGGDSSKEDYIFNPIPEKKRGGYKDYWVASDVLEFTSDGFKGYFFDKDMNKVEFEKYRVDAVTDYALDFLDKRSNDKPFFLFISYLEPHHQNNKNKYEGPLYSKEKFGNCKIPEDVKALGYGDSRENYADYLGACNSIDYNFGRIRAKLEEKNLLDDTVIIYTSDHGSHFRTRNKTLPEHGYDDYKRACEDAAIHVPLIIKGDSFNGSKREEKIVSLIDLPPTILKIAGIENADMDGKAIQNIIADNNHENIAFLQISESFVGRAIRTPEYTYAICDPNKNPAKDKDSLNYQSYILYDLKKDPLQLNNVVKDPSYAEVLNKLKSIIKDKIKKIESLDVTID